MWFAFKKLIEIWPKISLGYIFSLFWKTNGLFFRFYDNKGLNVVFFENKDDIFGINPMKIYTFQFTIYYSWTITINIFLKGTINTFLKGSLLK